MATGINNLPFPGKVYNPFDILTAEELNEDVSNIEALADGSGIGDGAVTALKTSFGGNYTTSEVNTGFKWIDNKDVYKRTISTTYTGGALSFAHGIAIATIISAEITVGTQSLPILNPGALTSSVGGWVTSTTLNIRAGSSAPQSGSVLATIYYTK